MSLVASLIPLSFLALPPLRGGPVAIGFKAGVNYTALRLEHFDRTGWGIPTEGTATGYSFHAGAFFRSSWGARSAFRGELLFSQRASALDYDYTLGENSSGQRVQGSATYRLDYFEFPLLWSYRPGAHFDLQLGAAPIVLFQARFEEEGVQTSASDPPTSLPYERLKNDTEDLAIVAFDLVGGVNYITSSGLEFGVRGLLDLGDIETTDDLKARQAVVQLSIGYAFKRKIVRVVRGG